MDSRSQEPKRHGTLLYPFEIYINQKGAEPFFVPYHWHQEIEILVLEQGKATVTVNGMDYPGKAGDVFIISPGELHSIQSEDDSIFYYACVFQLPFLSFEGFDQGQSQWLNPLLSHTLLFPTKIEENSPGAEEIRRELEELIQSNLRQDPGFSLFTKACLLKIISLMAREKLLIPVEKKASQYSSAKTELMKEMVSYLQSHYEEKITLDEIAKRFNLSPKYFCRFFKENFGKGMVEYLNYFRMEQAAKRLLETDQRILDVALGVGFENFSYFIKKFKEIYGCTPSAYREQARRI